MKLVFRRKLFWALTVAFAFTAVAGTLLHECGHYVVAKALGYSATISYAYTHWENPAYNQYIDSVFEKQLLTRKSNSLSPNQDVMEQVQKKAMKEYCWITLAGPLQTMLTGCLGLFLIFIFRKRYAVAKTLSFWMWLPLFLSLFWTRQIFNFFLGASIPLLKAIPSLQGDETKLSIYFNWPYWSLNAATALIGLIVSTFVIFKIVPSSSRTVFMMAGLVGGLGGFIGWIKGLGPILLP